MAKKNKKNDTSRRADESDVLRAKDIMPPFNQSDKTTNFNSKKSQRSIPQFDLAEEIMAEHRKITAIRRKSPELKIEPLRASGKPKTERIDRETFEEDQVIQEIVARDIKKLCRGGGFNL